MSGEGILNLNELDFRNSSNVILAKLTASANTITLTGASSADVLIKKVADPVANQDAATKAYVDANAGGSPGGADTNIQYNSGGSTFAGSANFTWNNGSSLLTVTGAINTTGLIQTGNSIRSNTSLILEDPGAGSNTITLQAPTLNPNASYTLTLPTDDGTNGQVLSTDGSGNLSWASGGSGTPSGANTQVQFNDDGSFGATSNFVWNNTSSILTVTGTTNFTEFTPKSSVRVATITNGTLATAYANGQTVDGVTLATNDRILIKDQTTATENGIYIVQASGAPTRSADCPIGAKASGVSVVVEQGTQNADTFWLCTTNSAVFNTDSIAFTELSGATSAELEYFQANISTDPTVPANGSKVAFNTTVSSTGNITNSSGTFTLEADKTYRLTGRCKVKTTSSGIEYQWRDQTTGGTPLIGIIGQTISMNNSTTDSSVVEAVAFISPTVSTDVELEIISGGASTTLDGSHCMALIEKISDSTAGGGGGTPGGADTQVQFNNAGAFGGSADFTWDGTSLKVTDGNDFTAGTDNDLVITHSGTAGSITSTTGNLTVDNQSSTSDTILKLGTATNATSFRVRDSADQDQFYVDMSGSVFTPQIRTGVTGNALGITSGEIVDTVSLRVYKTNERIYENPKSILRLQPKRFTWKADKTEDLGLIVEDALNKGLTEYIYYDPEKGPRNYKDRSLIAGLISCVKEQDSQIQTLTNQVKKLQQQMSKLI